jgi:hypothetical protein
MIEEEYQVKVSNLASIALTNDSNDMIAKSSVRISGSCEESVGAKVDELVLVFKERAPGLVITPSRRPRPKVFHDFHQKNFKKSNFGATDNLFLFLVSAKITLTFLRRKAQAPPALS